MEGQRDGEQISGQERNGEQLLEEVIGTQFAIIILQFSAQTFQTYKYTKADNVIQSRCVPHPPASTMSDSWPVLSQLSAYYFEANCRHVTSAVNISYVSKKDKDSFKNNFDTIIM